MKKALYACLILATILACDKNDDDSPPPPVEKDVVDLFPANNEISGWTRYLEMRVATNETELEAMIDGEAPLFINRGFEKGADQKYTGSAGTAVDTLTIFICDMGDSANAHGIYGDRPHEMDTPWTGDNPGNEARIDETLLFAWDIEFWDGRYYCQVTIRDENKTEASRNIAKSFALNVSYEIRDTTSTD
jgi:hypothetical protein